MASYLISGKYGSLKKSNHRNFPSSYKFTSTCKKLKDISTLMTCFAVISSVQLVYTMPTSTAQTQNAGFNHHTHIRFIKSVISYSCIWMAFYGGGTLYPPHNNGFIMTQIFEVHGFMEICNASGKISWVVCRFFFFFSLLFFNFYFFFLQK